MFPKDQYSADERQAMSDLMNSKNPAELATFMAKNQADKLAETQKALQAYRYDRDYQLQYKRSQTLNDQRVADLTQQYDNAITQQKQRMDADSNNMNVVMGTAGRLKSRNMQNAVSQALDVNRNIYTQLVSNKDRDIARLAEDLKYAQTVASNEYNDTISKDMSKMLESIQALDKTGSLATQQGLVQARSFVDSVVSNSIQHQADYYNKLTFIAQRFDQYQKEALENSKVDSSVTSQMNDGYLYSATGSIIKDQQGQPMTYNVQKQVQSVMKEDDGSTTILYKDGTHENKKFGADIQPDVLQNYAR
jgi:hypothetical protein